MNITTTIVLFGWPFVGLVLYVLMKPSRAMLTTVIGGLMFLPNAGMALSGLPDYDKNTAISLAAFVGALVLDTKSLTSIRITWFDAAIIMWILSPLPSSITNGLGVYDGVSGVLTHVILYGFPYLLGRAYCSTPAGIKELATAIVIGAIVYAPLCLWEVRMSPHLHQSIYGFAQIKSHMTKRLGGYRPMVFMAHGIQLGMFMAIAALIATWSWWTAQARQIASIPIGWCAAGLCVTLFLCNALNGYLVFVVALFSLWITRATQSRLVLWLVFLTPILYVGVRMTGDWTAQRVVNVVTSMDANRGASLNSRIVHEQLLISKAWQRPLFGWGTYGRNRADLDQDARDHGALGNRSITDSFWIIEFGQRGLVGLFGLGGVLLIPLYLLLSRHWRLHPLERDPLIVAALILTMFAMDCLFNAFPTAFYFTLSGGLVGLLGRRLPIRATIQNLARNGSGAQVPGVLW